MMDITAILHMHAELSLTAVFILMFLLDLFLPAPQRHWLRPMACILLTIQLLANLWPEEVTLFGGMYHSTPMVSVLKSILTIGTILVFLQADTWLKREDTRHKQGEFYILTLSTLLGMYFMVSAGHFLLFFLGLELATVPMACLVAFDKYKGHSAEAGAKFILSALFSSGIFLYGISMIYGTAGTLYFEDIPAGLTGTPLQVLALVFFFSGLAFKLSLVPFHLWTADTYQGAPTTVSAYLSVISKGAAAFALMIILMKVFGPMTEQWSEILCIIIVATITIANLFAIRQNNLKRFMAFSSISQAGYIMLAVLAGTPQGMASLVYYIVVYIAANLAVFGVINTIEQHTHGKIEREDYFVNDSGFLIFYIAALICGSLFNIDRNLLLRATVKLLPVAVISLSMGILLSGIMGIILGEGFWGGILYIGVPMTSGGMTAGTVPLSAMYSQALGVEAADVLTRMAPATVLGNCVAIIFGGLLNNFGKKHPETTGNGVLVNDGKTVKKTPPLKPTFASLCTGMIIAFAFYQIGAILHRFVPVIPTYAWMIIAVVLVKGTGIMSEELEDAAREWGQFAIKSWTAAALAGIGFTLIDLNTILKTLTPLYLITVVLIVGIITFTASVLGKLVGFFPLESAIAAGMCTTNMGGSGNVAVLSSAHRMELLPFAQIVTRSCGALMLTIGGILVQMVG